MLAGDKFSLNWPFYRWAHLAEYCMISLRGKESKSKIIRDVPGSSDIIVLSFTKQSSLVAESRPVLLPSSKYSVEGCGGCTRAVFIPLTQLISSQSA